MTFSIQYFMQIIPIFGKTEKVKKIIVDKSENLNLS